VNIVYFVLVLIGLVLIHEAGHMVVAKLCGMRVERFSVFFGRPIWSFRRGETEYAVGWVPLGGYVKITGMTREERIPPEVEPRAYYAAPLWKKVATIAAGPLVNIALAFLVFSGIYWYGVPSGPVTTSVGLVQEATPAAEIGLLAGDRILAVDDVVANGDPLRVQNALRAHPNQVVRLRYEREGRTFARDVRLGSQEIDGKTVGRLGFAFTRETERFGLLAGFGKGGQFTWEVLRLNVEAVGQLATSEEAREQINTVVGIGAVFDEVADDGVQVMQLIGLISLALGIFNLLPLLPLDGGHILFAVIEKVKRRHISLAAYNRFAMVGMAVLLLIFFIAIQNDIDLIRGGVGLVGR
jgi:regulator of sigma E protease